MTVATVRRIGNSLGFTIPAEEAKRLGLHAGDQVDVQMRKAAGMETIAGLLKGKLGDVDAFMHQMDLEEAGAEARREAQLDAIFDRRPVVDPPQAPKTARRATTRRRGA